MKSVRQQFIEAHHLHKFQEADLQKELPNIMKDADTSLKDYQSAIQRLVAVADNPDLKKSLTTVQTIIQKAEKDVAAALDKYFDTLKGAKPEPGATPPVAV